MSAAACTILGSAVLALLLAGYFGQRYLPPPKPKIVGIDLGTTFSCIGAYHAVTGEVDILEDDEGHACIPSVVAFRGKEILIGYEAANQAEHNPENTIYDAKRFIGKSFSSEELREEALRYPFKMVADETGLIRYVLRDRPAGETPQTIGSYLLGQLRRTAAKRLDVPVTKAVISVPAEFDDEQREATKQAAQLAGIEVLRVITEPTAAALAYGLHKRSAIHNVLVVDLGGGTLDVSLLNIQGGMFLTQATAGNNHLGGQDFNERLVKFYLSRIHEQYGRTLSDPDDLQSLRQAVEELKLGLTADTTATLRLPLRSLGADAEFWHATDRGTFERLNRDLFDKVLEPIRRALAAGEVTPSEVDSVVLVGGSTRIPAVRRLIGGHFGRAPDTSVQPELAVVIGVALQAGILGGMWPLTVSAIEVPRRVNKIHVR